MYTNEAKNAFWRPEFGIWRPFYWCESPKGNLGKNLAWSTVWGWPNLKIKKNSTGIQPL